RVTTFLPCFTLKLASLIRLNARPCGGRRKTAAFSVPASDEPSSTASDLRPERRFSVPANAGEAVSAAGVVAVSVGIESGGGVVLVPVELATTVIVPVMPNDLCASQKKV